MVLWQAFVRLQCVNDGAPARVQAVCCARLQKSVCSGITALCHPDHTHEIPMPFILQICSCPQIIDADADKAMLAYYFRRQEEHKVVCKIACSAPGSAASVYAITVCTHLLALPLAECTGS